MNTPKNAFPDPAIIKKLESFRPGSGEVILSLVKVIGEQQRSKEVEQLKTLSFKDKCKTLCQNFYAVMALYPMPLGLSSPSPQAYADYYQNADWGRTGDFMRLAIGQYMQENEITDEMLGLTQQEKDSLTLRSLKVSPAANPAQPH